MSPKLIEATSEIRARAQRGELRSAVQDRADLFAALEEAVGWIEGMMSEADSLVAQCWIASKLTRLLPEAPQSSPLK